MEFSPNKNQITSDPAIQELLFFYAEYIKRKFYLDCMVKKKEEMCCEEDIYCKNGTQYVYLDCSNHDTAIQMLYRRFSRRNDSVLGLISNLNHNDIDCEKYHYNIYNLLKGEFEHYLNIVKDMISSPKKYSIKLVAHQYDFLNNVKNEITDDK